jgi:hypothetical protein
MKLLRYLTMKKINYCKREASLYALKFGILLNQRKVSCKISRGSLHDKAAMTCFKYQLYLDGSNFIKYLNAIL